MNKEQIYDEKIAHLMTEIIGICKAHGIAMVASYEIPNEEDPELCCTTVLQNETGVIPDHFKAARSSLLSGSRHPSPMMITTTHADGSKTLTAVIR